LTKEELRIETNTLIEEFLKTKQIKQLSRKRKQKPPLMGLIDEYRHHSGVETIV
jgi:hypothetical protein